MTDIEELLPRILPYAPGCPEPVAFAAIITAAQEFCRRTRLWRDTDVFNVTPTSCNVVCAPGGASVYEIESAWLGTMKLDPIALDDLDRQWPTWRQYSAGQGQWITQIERDTVLVVPPCTGSLRLSTYLMPIDGAEYLPDFMVRDYARVLGDGALAEILMTPAQSFTDPNRAQFYSARFTARLDQLNTQSIKGQQRAPVRTRGQFM